MNDARKRNAAHRGMGDVSGDSVQGGTAGSYSAPGEIATREPSDAHARLVFRWPEQVRRDRSGKLTKFDALVAAEIAAYLNRKSATAWPGKKRLAASLGCDPRSIPRAIRRLIGAGHLEVFKGGTGRGHTNELRPILRDQPASETVTAESPFETERGTGESPIIGGKGDSAVRKGWPASHPIHLKEPSEDLSGAHLPCGDLFGQPVKPRSSRRKLDIPLPADWQPDTSHFELGEQLGLSPERVRLEADAMRDWAASKGATSRDWDARFRNWLRTALTMSRAPASPRERPRSGRESAGDLVFEDYVFPEAGQ